MGSTGGRVGGTYSASDTRRADYAPSANDIRQRFTFSSVYELPFGKGKRWMTAGMASRFLGGWGIGNVTVVQSAPPFTVVTQANTTNAFSAGAQPPLRPRGPRLGSAPPCVGPRVRVAPFPPPP